MKMQIKGNVYCFYVLNTFFSPSLICSVCKYPDQPNTAKAQPMT